MSKRDEQKLRAQDVARANEVANQLRAVQAQQSFPKTALLMKNCNDLHAMIAGAAKDTRELIGKIAGEFDPTEWTSLDTYRVELVGLEQRVAKVYARALALHVRTSHGSTLSKITERVAELEKELAELTQPPEVSSLIELPNS